jgi:LCP family protein required for cell wall assembly
MTYVVYALIFLTALFIVIFTVKGFKCVKKNKTKSYVWYFIFLILFIAAEIFITVNINKISSSLSKITSNNAGYSSSIVVLSDSDYDSISDIKEDDAKIGIINDEDNQEGYVLPMQIVEDEGINEENLASYDEYENMLNDLYDGEIDAMFVSSSYVSLFASYEGYENIADETKVIYEKTEETEKETSTTGRTLDEPFTILLMGVDSNTNSLSKSNSFNGDTLMLITFNPHTMNATILSIPRDTRVPIVCTRSKAKNKINSAALYGADCVMDTITNFTGIEIDYWVKVNFQGVISLVDALGGIEVDVPYAFCESDSKRRFGNNTIYIEKGLQTLNGEQTLAFARNRHTWPQYCGRKYSNYNSNDFIRGQNQQQIVKAIVNKLKGINSLSEIYDILDILGDNVDTNIDKDTMITGFDTFKNILFNSRNINSDDFIGTQRLYLSGYDNTINGIYYFEYYKQSLNEIVDAMEINLELKEPEMDKEFSFSINNPYEDTQIGKGTYSY